MKRLPAWLMMFILLSLLVSQAAHASNILDQTTDAFRVASVQFGERIKIFGLQLLALTAVIQIALTMLKKMISGASLEDIFSTLLFANILPFGFFIFLIYSSSTVLPSIIASFDFVGQKGSGLDQLTPSEVMTQGIELQYVMVMNFKDAAGTGVLDAVRNFYPAIIFAGCCLIVLLSFMILSAQMALAMISGYFWVAVTPFILGFGGVSFTRDIAIGAVKGGITIGMKILCVYLIAGVAVELAPIMGNGMGNVTLTDWSPLFWVTGVSFILSYLSFQLPKLASDLMNGTASLSAGDAGSNVAAAAAMTVGAGVAAAGVVGGASQALYSAASAGMQGLGGGSLSSAAAAGMEAGEAAAGGSLAVPPPPVGGSAVLPGGGLAVPPPSPGTGASGALPGGGVAVPPPPIGASSGGLGDASGSSLSGTEKVGDSNTSSPGIIDRASSAYSKVMEGQRVLPQDAHAVGLSANISTRGD
jgi:type IV secretion system protein TrbL